MNPEILVLRAVHVLGGIFWLGGGIYSAVFVMPALAKAGPAMGAVMEEMNRRRLFTILPTVAVLTMLSGLRLLWIVSGGFDGPYFQRPVGATYLAAGITSLVGFSVAMLISRPAAVKAGELQLALAGLEPGARDAAMQTIQSLRLRSSRWTAVAVWLVVAAGLGMAVARYL